jgi:hypothetical protein
MVLVAGDITITRGDDGAVEYSVTESGTTTVVDITGFGFKFTVKHRTVDPSPYFTLSTSPGIQISSPTGGVVEVHIPNSQTNTMPPGKYKYDFQMTTTSTKVYTLASGQFTVTEDVTR